MKLVSAATGELVDVPDDQVQSAFKSGKFGLPKGSSLPVVSAAGTVGSVSAKDASASLNTGQHTATRAEYKDAQQEARYGGIGGAIEGAVVGAARGVGSSVGVPTDKFLEDAAFLLTPAELEKGTPFDDGPQVTTGGERMHERIEGLESQQGGAMMGGELAGMLGAAALGGGGALGRLGTLAEEGGAALGLGKFGGMVARGAVEGGYMGGLQAVDEAALGDVDLTAEKVLAGVGHGALLGGAGGALFGGLHVGAGKVMEAGENVGRSLLSKLDPKAIDALAEKTYGFVPKGLGEAVAGAESKSPLHGLQQKYADLAAEASGVDREAIDKLTRLSPEGREARRLAIYETEAVQDSAARAIREHGDRVLSADRLIADEAMGTLKADHVRRAIQTGNEEVAAKSALAQIDRVIENSDAIINSEGFASNPFKRSVETASTAAYRAKAAIEEALARGGDNADVFVQMDSLKRSMQKLTRNAYQGSMRVADPLGQMEARSTAEAFDGIAQGLRGHLQDEALWGKAAADQRAINEAWTKQIDSSSRFHKSLTTEVGRDPRNPYLQARGIDPEKATSYVRGLTNPNKDLTHTAVRDYLSSTEKLADAISTSYELPAAKMAEVEALKAATKGFQSELSKAEETLTLSNQFKAMRDTDGFGDALALGGAGLGGLLGGAPGAIVGGGVGALASPYKTVARLAALERLAENIDKKIGTNISHFFEGSRVPGPGPSSRILSAPGKTEGEVFEKSFSRLQEVVANPQGVAAGVARTMGAVGDAAPRTAAVVAMRAQEMAEFLVSKAPPGMVPSPYSLAPQKHKPLYSDGQMREWARYAAAVNDPVSVLDSLRRGDISTQEVEVLNKFYPKLGQQIRAQIVSEIAEKGHELARPQRLALGVLFALPTDEDLTQPFIATAQGLYGAMPDVKDATSPGQPPGKPMNVHLSAPRSASEQAQLP